MRASLIEAGLLAGAALSQAANAQSETQPPPEGPVVVGAQRETWKPFDLERLQADFDFLGQYRSNSLTVHGQPKLIDREQRFRETLNLSGEAAIGHKNLLDITASAQLGLETLNLDSDTVGMSATEQDFVDIYSLSALLLGNGPVPLTVYSFRQQNTLDRAFAGTIDEILSETGAIAQIESDRAPTTLQYFHRDQTLNDAFGQNNSNVVQDTFTGVSGIRITANQQLNIAYTYDHVDEQQTGVPGDMFDRHDGNFVHTLAFGPDALRSELRSSFRFYNQDGNFPQGDAKWQELLILRHTDRLESFYNLTVDQQSRTGQDQRLYRGEATVRYRLFDSLVTTARAGGQRITTPDDFTSDDLFTGFQLDYTKAVPLGRLEASAGLAYDAQSNSDRGGTLSVINQAHVFIDPFPITLVGRNIVPGSILVVPPIGFPRYREGIDYTVQIFADRAELRVPPGSTIQNGQTVLVSYEIGPEPGSDIDTLGTTLSFRYTLTEGFLQGLALYTTYNTVNHSLTAKDPSQFVLDNVQDLLLGAEYIRGGLDVKVEQNYRDSTVDPYNNLQAWVTFNQPLGRNSFVSLQATHGTTDYTLLANHVDFNRVTGMWNQTLNQSLDFNVRLEYRNEQNRINGNSEGFQQILGFTWHKAQTTIYVSFENDFLNGPGSDGTSQLIQIGFTRTF